jgi:hypothetical protein
LKEHVVLIDGLYGHCQLQAWRAAGDEVAIRALRALIDVFGGSSPRPRLIEIETLHADLIRQDGPTKRTLGGVVFRIMGEKLDVWREAGRSGLPRAPLTFGTDILWDGRFTIGLTPEGAHLKGLEVGPLGPQGFALIRGVLGTEVSAFPREACLTLPAIWQQGVLLAVPFFQSMLIAARNSATDSMSLSSLSQLIEEADYFSDSSIPSWACAPDDWHGP